MSIGITDESLLFLRNVEMVLGRNRVDEMSVVQGVPDHNGYPGSGAVASAIDRSQEGYKIPIIAYSPTCHA